MRFPLAVSAAAILAIAIAACSGSQSSTYIATPSPAGPATSGPVVLTQNALAQNAGTASGITGTVTYVGGAGTVTATSSSTAPTGTTTVSPAAIVRVQASATSPNVYYLTISSTTGATLTGLPQIDLLLSTAAIGTFQEAQFGGGTWTNIPGATPVVNTAQTAVEFPAGKTAITIAAGGSLYLAFYQGNFPQPTPTPSAAPTNILADSNFENPVPIATYGGYAVTTTGGWQQCTINPASPVKPNRALSTFAAPSPPATPGAVVESAGFAVPQGTGTPAAVQKTVLANSPTHALLLGGVFNGDGTTANKFNLEDFRYNGVCQKIKVPANPTMTMALMAEGNQTASFFDFEVDVLDANNNFVGNLYEDTNTISATNGGDSTYRTVTVPSSTLSPYVGQSVTLFAGVWIDGSNAAYTGYYFLDDLQLVGNP
jgi:hypothetical protein